MSKTVHVKTRGYATVFLLCPSRAESRDDNIRSYVPLVPKAEYKSVIVHGGATHEMVLVHE